jgi:hypothetical protein
MGATHLIHCVTSPDFAQIPFSLPSSNILYQ